MENGQYGVMIKHAWARIAHDQANLLTFFRSITVDGASGTGGFMNAKGTMLDPLEGIGCQDLTILAKGIT